MTHPDTRDLAIAAAQKLDRELELAALNVISYNGRPRQKPDQVEPISRALEAFAKGRVDAVLKKLTSPEVVEATAAAFFAMYCERIDHQDLPEVVWNRLPEESREEWRGDAMAALTAATKKLRTP